MTRYSRGLLVAVLAIVGGCTDQITHPTGPSSPGRPASSLAAAPAPHGVGAIGIVDQIDAQERTLVLLQTGLDFTPGKGVTITDDRFAVGSRNARLPVLVAPDARISLTGQDKALADLAVGDRVIVAGQREGEALQATVITDLSPVPPPTARQLQNRAAQVIANRNVAPRAGEETWCRVQVADFTKPNQLLFQGCVGGPAIGDMIPVNFPFFWVLLGYLKMDYVSYEASLGGWGFAFPFEFSAQPNAPLVYHVPAVVSLGVAPQPAEPASLSYYGGLGFNVSLNFDFCTNFGDCSDLYTFSVGVGYEAEYTGPGPIDTAQEVDVEEPTCISLGIIDIKGITSLPGELCPVERFQGQPFGADVTAAGTHPTASSRFAFQGGTYAMAVKPDSTALSIRFDNMRWAPVTNDSVVLKFSILNWDILRVPLFATEKDTLPFVSTPYPSTDARMKLARTAAGDPVYQPTSIEFSLPVSKAPTRVTITSGQALSEGTPVSLRLSEAYDGAPISGQTLTIAAVGLGGTRSVMTSLTTNADGIVTVPLPPGQYSIDAQYLESPHYLASSAQMPDVYVYRLTTFVIWGGNAGGLVPGSRVQFWGSGWSKQVTAGSYGGSASFLGYAINLEDDTWDGPPGSSGHGPATIPDIIAVIVTNHVEGRGAHTIGNIVGRAVLRVDDPASYQPNAGHSATGVVRAVIP